VELATLLDECPVREVSGLVAPASVILQGGIDEQMVGEVAARSTTPG
jgi:hypothetical protein